ncbi:hypothetical protein [Streptomyces sp. Wb2n-11]|uniref:hypothetical protein n=1 Tax=Streptomyces sp. Wb2n-11 TaxID=1030533 RepID=UPI000AD7BB2D|nr:hypothetical protein [Streptomyces sp. Wb2n-11]
MLDEAGIEAPAVFGEQAGTSGRLHPLERPKSGELLGYARPGDAVHLSEVFRLVRGTGHILHVLDVLHRDRAGPVGFTGPEFTRVITEGPLSACLRGLHDPRENALADVLAGATGAPGDDITPRTAAALLGGVHRVLFRRIQERTLAGRTHPEIAAVLAEEATRAFGLLEPALADYARAEPNPPGSRRPRPWPDRSPYTHADRVPRTEMPGDGGGSGPAGL